MTSGGKRTGAGRPPAPPTFLVRIRLPLEHKPDFVQIGGDVFAKRVIVEAIKAVKL